MCTSVIRLTITFQLIIWKSSEKSAQWTLFILDWMGNLVKQGNQNLKMTKGNWVARGMFLSADKKPVVHNLLSSSYVPSMVLGPLLTALSHFSVQYATIAEIIRQNFLLINENINLDKIHFIKQIPIIPVCCSSWWNSKLTCWHWSATNGTSKSIEWNKIGAHSVLLNEVR